LCIDSLTIGNKKARFRAKYLEAHLLVDAAYDFGFWLRRWAFCNWRRWLHFSWLPWARHLPH
jgi:hypothetical protein